MIFQKQIFNPVSVAFIIMVVQIDASESTYTQKDVLDNGKHYTRLSLSQLQVDQVRLIGGPQPEIDRPIDTVDKNSPDASSLSSIHHGRPQKLELLKRYTPVPLFASSKLRSANDRPGTPKPGREIAQRAIILPLIEDTPLLSPKTPKKIPRTIKRQEEEGWNRTK